MPVYESACLQCGKRHEYVRPVAQFLDTPECCGAKTEKRIYTVPMSIVDIPAYESPASGKWITSRRERIEDFKRTGTRPWEGMEQEKKEAARQKAYDDAKLDAKIDHTVRKAWQELPDSKKAQVLQA